MEINKATVKELYEAVRRLQEVVIEQRNKINYLERRINNFEEIFYRRLDYEKEVKE